METKTMLEKLAESIERVLKSQATTATPRVQKMRPEALVAHALAEIQKAAKEPVEIARKRLGVLGRAVDTAKQAFVDTGSEEVEVEIFEEETTVSEEESEKEISPVALEAAEGNAAFASNPEDLHKALAQLAKDIAGLRADTPKDESKTAGGKGEVEKSDIEWPADMNTPTFREGVAKAEKEPAWGYDPAGTGGQSTP